MAMFESLDAFRAHCGEPTMPIEQCPICSRIPSACGRENVDYLVKDDRPPQVALLENFIERGSDGKISRCPTCHRLYLYEVTFLDAEDYRSSWNRYDVEELFDVEWCVVQRLPDRPVQWVLHGLFPNHAIVRFEDSDGWSALDHDNRLAALDGKAALATLIDSDPPRVTGDLDLARRYAAFVDGIENPGDRRQDAFESIVWIQPLWDFEQRRVDAARAASHVEEPVAERVGEEVRVRFWVTSGRRLICRVITVQPDGHHRREDTVTAEHLPIPAKREPFFESLDAFRAHCGEPTMPLEQCPICSTIPESSNSDDVWPPENERLDHFIENYVRRCPTCHRLYSFWTFSGGNDIYRGNETTWYLDRCSVDAMFHSGWSVQQRVPDRRAEHLCPDRFFPNHLLVRFGSKSWAALDAVNRLVMLDSHEAIVRLIDIDPPSVLADIELAKRYALFIDELEHPDDSRLDSPTRPVAERDGDRVVVRSWVTSQKRPICRILTVQPSGHVIIEDLT